MIRFHLLASVAIVTGFAFCVSQVQAVTLLYEPFDYAESNFLSATAIGATNNTSSPIGYLAPNFNNWYGTGIDVGGYQTANDGQVTATDLSYAGLAKPSSTTHSLSVGSTGYTMRLSLNSSTQASPNKTGPNLTDTADPLAGTDNTLQASDTGHSGYYSILLKVNDVTNLSANGGVLLGFNNIINAQVINPTTTGAGLTIRPKAGGAAGEFQLGVVKMGSTNFLNATWDTANTYNINSTIFVVGKYQTVGALQGGPPFTQDDIASMWINPTPNTFGAFDPAGALTNTAGDDMTTDANGNNHTLQSFIIRQTGTGTNNQVPVSVTYDELRVGTTWADVTPGLPGDFNGNGVVDAADYVTWRHGGPLANEVTGRGTVNAADYTDWQSRYGNAASGSGVGSGSTVPEPAALLLVTMLASLLGLRRGARA